MADSDSITNRVPHPQPETSPAPETLPVVPHFEGQDTEQQDTLFHISLNPYQPETIVFLHGLWSSHLEYALVTPHLNSFHLILVDLPGHGESASLANHDENLTIPAMAHKVAHLIRRHAHNGRAHIVGLSMGGFVTMSLADRYPSLCQSAFVTGAAPFEGMFAFMAKHCWVVYGLMWTFKTLPDGIYWWLLDVSGSGHVKRFKELRVEQQRNLDWRVVKAVYWSILESLSEEQGWEVVRRLGKTETGRVRMVNVSGAKMDDLGSAAGIKKVWTEEGALTGPERNRVVVIKEAVHAWDLQFPELFATGVEAWVKGDELPVEFEDL
ncbi:Dihydrolipoyllysine-residue acetyltransferase component of acetoin cleaving system [Rhypophila sp. PSN 637]